jgi:4'-phosphopantetheinyl transferase
VFQFIRLAADGGPGRSDRVTAPDPGTIAVIRVSLDASLPGALDYLSPDERARAARFVFDRDRRRFITSHAWTRIAIASCLDCAPASLRFATGARGKPFLVGAAQDIRFNLAHSGERALIAIGTGQEIGVDLEAHRSIDPLEIARGLFAPAEVAVLEALSEADRAPAFFRGWTRKEAFIKALGDGFSFPVHQFEVTLAEDPSAQLLRSCAVLRDATSRWRVIALPAEPGYTAALAAEAGPWRVQFWEANLR